MNTKGHESKGLKPGFKGVCARPCSVSPLCAAESLVETLSSFVFIRVHSWFNGMLPVKTPGMEKSTLPGLVVQKFSAFVPV